MLDFSFCASQYEPPVFFVVVDIAQTTLGVVMCLLIVVRFIREAFQMYKATKRLSFNRYMNLLVREGIIYFIVCVYISLFVFLFCTTTLGLTTISDG